MEGHWKKRRIRLSTVLKLRRTKILISSTLTHVAIIKIGINHEGPFTRMSAVSELFSKNQWWLFTHPWGISSVSVSVLDAMHWRQILVQTWFFNMNFFIEYNINYWLRLEGYSDTLQLCFSISEKTQNIIIADTKFHGTDVTLTLKEKYVKVSDMSECVHYNIWQWLFFSTDTHGT
jgi:hypothetical protein